VNSPELTLGNSHPLRPGTSGAGITVARP